ncbi:hypothetical protein [Lignipirellula cremea]|uniref:Uncharacterized protein n=1 Tax=Lignipirellula cremea TaxID=2528010 RepID=A0A518DW84_9BACT|nr:hypothetical protein [Lignipirellula cremea]QDU96094.1 hypothetical protein Pla8534_39130 [Lignipirellula cremea]
MRSKFKRGTGLASLAWGMLSLTALAVEPDLTPPPLLSPVAPVAPVAALRSAPPALAPAAAIPALPQQLEPRLRTLPEPPPFLLRPEAEAEEPKLATPPDAPEEPPAGVAPFQFSDELNSLLNAIVRANVPHTFQDERKWGRTKEVWAGIRLRREGLKIETERRKKVVNDGDWWRHEAALLGPQKNLLVRFQNPVEQADGSVAFDAIFSTPLQVHSRYAKWVQGVQLLSISADARATIRLEVRCEMRVQLDPSKLPPDFVLLPQATAARLTLSDFRLDRISKVGGAIANEIGEAAEGVLREKLEDYEPKLVQKINAAIAKKKDRLRVSMQDMLQSKWSDLTTPATAQGE